MKWVESCALDEKLGPTSLVFVHFYANLSKGNVEVTSYISEYSKQEARISFDSTDPGKIFMSPSLSQIVNLNRTTGTVPNDRKKY